MLARTVGVVVMWLGVALRVWAMAALGGAFRTTIEVDAEQTVSRRVRIGGSATRPTAGCC